MRDWGATRAAAQMMSTCLQAAEALLGMRHKSKVRGLDRMHGCCMLVSADGDYYRGVECADCSAAASPAVSPASSLRVPAVHPRPPPHYSACWASHTPIYPVHTYLTLWGHAASFWCSHSLLRPHV